MGQNISLGEEQGWGTNEGEDRTSRASSVGPHEVSPPVKLVLYGAGDVGKTTFLHRLMMMDPENTFADPENVNHWKSLICFNIVEGAAIVINNGLKLYHRQFDAERCQSAVKLILDRYRVFQNYSLLCNLNNSQELVEAILHLRHNCSLFEKLLKKRQRFSLFETWLYFIDKLQDYPSWGGENWIPSTDDILRISHRTIGANTTSFEHNEQHYAITDLGGQKSERKLNLLHESQMDCLIFFASLTEHSETLFEDDGNRLFDSLRLWKQVISHPSLEGKVLILVLNKFDLFQKRYFEDKKRIQKRFNYPQDPPTVDMEEDANCSKAIEWFRELYMDSIPENMKNRVRIIVTSIFQEEPIMQAIEEGLEFIHENLE